MIRFAPRWLTSATSPLGNGPWLEGTQFGYSLVAEDIGTVSVPYSETLTIPLGSQSSSVLAVTVNGTNLDQNRISRAGRNLTLDLSELGLGNTLLIEILRISTLTFSLLHGELPPGVSIAEDGYLSGMILNIPGNVTKSYEFTARVSNNLRVSDRAFSVLAVPSSHLTEWVLQALPTPTFLEAIDTDVYPFGSLKRAAAISARLEATDADEAVSSIEVRPTDLPDGDFFEGLPLGISVQGSSLIGVIHPSVAAGQYLFRLGFVGQTQNSIIGQIIVEDALSTNVERPTVIRWVTTALDPMVETYPAEITLRAEHASLPITYTLAPGSLPLPPGLTLNLTSGDIEGQASHVLATTTYNFIVRANAGENFLDRAFSLTILSRFSSDTILDLRLKLPYSEQTTMRARYASVIERALLYRPRDVNFGIPPEPYIYLIKGLRAGDLEASMAGDGSRGIDGSDYHGPISLLLGPHRSAVVRDQKGDVRYEVIYRMIIDPQARAGGFSFTSDEVVEQKVVYAQAALETYVFPRSLRNARLDLIRDLGFATTDPALTKLAGPSGVEALPTWMTSEQIAGDPSSVLGFVPGLVVATVLPGKSQEVIDLIEDDEVLSANGREITLTRFYQFTVTYQSATTFEENETTYFDGPPYTPETILFDADIVVIDGV